MTSLNHRLRNHRLRDHRAVVIGGRVALWAAVVLVLGRGIVSLFGGAAAGGAPDATTRTEAAAEQFPAGDATALALRFTADYLTYDADQAADWATRVGAYGNDTLARGWDGTGRQTVSTVVPAGVEAASPAAGTVTVAARTPGGWVHLAVPVVKANGGLAIAAAPAFVAAPSVGDAPDPAADGDATTAEALRPALEAFFDAYGTGATAVLGAMTADGATLARLDPGRLALSGVEAVTVEKAPAGPTRVVFAVVGWADQASGARLTQTYRLGVVQSGQRWLVASLGAATPTATQPNPKKEK
jgi:hypothetical protein